MMCPMEQMLKDINIVDFTVIELTLFLDTHPCDRSAIEYFNHYNRIRTQLKKEFSKTYYPLTLDYAEGNQDWRWAEAPLPWEGGCR